MDVELEEIQKALLKAYQSADTDNMLYAVKNAIAYAEKNKLTSLQGKLENLQGDLEHGNLKTVPSQINALETHIQSIINAYQKVQDITGILIRSAQTLDDAISAQDWPAVDAQLSILHNRMRKLPEKQQNKEILTLIERALVPFEAVHKAYPDEPTLTLEMQAELVELLNKNRPVIDALQTIPIRLRKFLLAMM